MVGVAAVNRLRLTPQLVADADATAAQRARSALCRNATIEAALGAAIIAIVAVLGTLPPGSHANHHAAEGLIPPDAAFQHIHGEDGMADVTIEPGLSARRAPPCTCSTTISIRSSPGSSR